MSETVQIMLRVDCTAAARAPLQQALSEFDVACVLIVPADGSDTNACQSLVSLIQEHAAAAIIANDTALAQATGADGCHLDEADDIEARYGEVRGILGPQSIVGVMPGADGPLARHTAMQLAESGADYIGYIVSAEPDDSGLARVGWWAEIFESPVVAFTDGDINVCGLAIDVGPPDFLALPLPVSGAPADLTAVAALIKERGQLPVAAKDAK